MKKIQLLRHITTYVIYFSLGLMLSITYVACAQVAPATGVNPPVPEDLQPLIDLLGGKAGSWVSTAVAWMAAVSFAMAPFAVRVRNLLADMMNEAAVSSTEDDDIYLLKLFSQPWYKGMAFVLNFMNIRFPTLAELQRSLRLQREAAELATARFSSIPYAHTDTQTDDDPEDSGTASL